MSKVGRVEEFDLRIGEDVRWVWRRFSGGDIKSALSVGYFPILTLATFKKLYDLIDRLRVMSTILSNNINSKAYKISGVH